MRIATGSDWRDGIAFETPLVLSEAMPGEPTRCSVCGGSTEPRDRSELWVVKHRHPKNHDGHVRFYCAEHLPEIRRPQPVATASAPARASATRTPRERAPQRRSPSVEETPKPLCPDCFVEVPPSGVCGMCGQTVSA